MPGFEGDYEVVYTGRFCQNNAYLPSDFEPQIWANFRFGHTQTRSRGDRLLEGHGGRFPECRKPAVFYGGFWQKTAI
jgi:hypothetical protein